MEAACSTNPVCEDIGCESNLSSLNSKGSNTEDQQYACSNNMNDTVEIEIQEGFNYSSESKKESFIDEEFGVPTNGVHLQDSHAQFSEIDSISHENDMANSMEISTYMESGLSDSFDGRAEKCLSKSATFPSSELEFSSHSFCVEEIEASSTYKRSVSLPAPSSHLVSAMKGGRAQNGLASRSGLRVEWALDVYDPPVTSMLPIVQSNNHQRLKSKKNNKPRHKHAKGNKEKKHAKGHI